jgi:cob(I)alamin adenosyltransferase
LIPEDDMTKDAIEETLAKYSRGLIMVFTGDGKGKTTAALGQALRALGHGKKVLVIQFMKGRKYGEVICAEQCLPNLTVRLCGLDSFVMRGNPAPVDVELARQGLDLARNAILSGDYDMIILDEINVAMDFGLVPVDSVVSMLKHKPAAVDVILTGRYAPKAIVDIADTVSEVKEIKHHYSQGIKERAGIEF